MRKIMLLHFVSLIMLQLIAQTKTVTIHGIVKDTTVKSIEISHVVDDKLSKWENKQIKIENGGFNTSIQLPFPVEAVITYGNKVSTKNYIYADAKILIDTAGMLHLIGSPLQDEYENEFLPFFRSNDQAYESLKSFYQRNYSKYDGDFPKIIKDSATFLQDKYYSQRANLLSEYIKRHPNSYVALWDIYFFISMTPVHRYFDFEKLFSCFSNQMQQQQFMVDLKERIKESVKMQVGQMFPKDFFKGYEQLHNNVKKDNQYYLIDFWFSHCSPCAKKFPKLKEIYEKFHGKGFDIVSISVDKKKDKKDYVAAIQKYDLVWKHIWDKEGAIAQKFNINVFPTYILVDKKGKIINSNIQDDELEAFLKKNL